MPLDLSNPGRKIHIGVVLMGLTEILDVAPVDIFHAMSTKFLPHLPVPEDIKAKALDVEIHWVTELGTPAKMTANMTIEATDSFETCPQLDIVLMGAYFMDFVPNEAELAFLRKAYEESTAFLTICGGFVPAQLAGVLVEKTCTAPRFMVSTLQKEDPRTTWVEKRYVRDGKLWTSGALLNGLDLMSAFAYETWPELAQVAVPLGGWPERGPDY